MNLQLFAQVVHHGLKILFAFGADIHTIIEILRGKDRFCRSLPRQAQDMAPGITQEIALCDPHQGKLRRIIISIRHNPMSQGFGKGKGNLIPHLPGKSKKLQCVFRQSNLHRRLRKPSLRQTGVCGPCGNPVLPVFRQIQGKLVIQLLIPQRNKTSGIGQAGILFQHLCLFLRQLYKGRITVPADGDGLLLAHGGKHACGLPHRGGHHGRQDHSSQNEKRRQFL